MDIYETFYTQDWGSDHEARRQRDYRRIGLAKLDGTAAVVRARVTHPSIGVGYEVALIQTRDPGRFQDFRITPREAIHQSSFSTIVEIQEGGDPSWRS